MAKPFSIQSPENIAKEYAGNKQRIAEAMQLGIVDATAGVLAGMFIDRMRSAQMQEQVPQQTVAQQVMGGAPPPPPPPPSGGLGATPQAALQAAPQGAPPMAPPMDMPPEMGMEQPGMAEGGIVGLDVPSYMFDEPDNGSYAGGGLVAFAQGGGADLAAFRRAIIQQESGGRYGIPNAEGSGAMGIGQIMPDTARALAKRLGLPYRPDLLAGKDKAAQDYQIALTNEATREAWDYGDGDIRSAAAYYHAGPNKKGWGPKTAKYQNDILRRLGMDSGEAEVAERDLGTAAGRAMSAEDALGLGQKFVSGLPREELDRAKKYAMEELDPANQEKERKADMWQALAEMGFRMAASNSPHVLQAIGEAATATLPGVAASKKERKAAKNEAVRTLMAAEDVDRKTALAGVDLGIDIYKTGLSQEQFKQQMALREKELSSLEARTADELALKRAALLAQGEDKTDFDKKFAAVKSANPGLSDMQVLLVMKSNGLLGSPQSGVMGEWPGASGAQGGGAPQGDDGIAIVGSRPAQ